MNVSLSRRFAAGGAALGRHRRSLALAAGLLAATIAMAMAIPVNIGAGASPEATQDVSDGALAAVAREDLGAFLDSKRWGASLRESRANAQSFETGNTQGASDAAAAPATAHFVGFIAAEDRRSAFLALADGNLVRLALDATLADGRVVAAIADDAVTLRSASGDEEVLALFPSDPSPTRGAYGRHEQRENREQREPDVSAQMSRAELQAQRVRRELEQTLKQFPIPPDAPLPPEDPNSLRGEANYR